MSNCVTGWSSTGYNSTNVFVKGFFGERQQVFEMSVNDFQAGMDKIANGALIQNAFPNLTPSQREFMMTGMTDAEFDDACNEDISDEEWLERNLRIWRFS
jgi:hypothetical protein